MPYLTKPVSVSGITAILMVTPLLIGTQRAPHTRFPPVVNAAMTQVQRITPIFLSAPTWMPHTMPPVIGRLPGYPVARVQATRTRYTVTIDYARHPLPVNSKRWATENLDPVLNSYLIFGARQYPHNSAAIAALHDQRKMLLQLGPLPRASRVALASHQIAQYQLADKAVSLMTWHEHGWTITMSESFAASSPVQAKAWATETASTFMTSVPPCPSRHGVLVQEGGGSMNTVIAVWAIGRRMYTVGSDFGMHPVVQAITSWTPWSPPKQPSFWSRVIQWWDH